MRHATHVHHKIFAPSSFTFPPSGTAVGGLPRSPAEVDCLSAPHRHRRTGSPSRKKKVVAGGVGVVDVDCFLGISDGQFFVPTPKKELIAIQFNITADLAFSGQSRSSRTPRFELFRWRGTRAAKTNRGQPLLDDWNGRKRGNSVRYEMHVSELINHASSDSHLHCFGLQNADGWGMEPVSLILLCIWGVTLSPWFFFVQKLLSTECLFLHCLPGCNLSTPNLVSQDHLTAAGAASCSFLFSRQVFVQFSLLLLVHPDMHERCKFLLGVLCVLSPLSVFWSFYRRFPSGRRKWKSSTEQKGGAMATGWAAVCWYHSGMSMWLVTDIPYHRCRADSVSTLPVPWSKRGQGKWLP